MKHVTNLLRGIVLMLLFVGVSGCDSLDDLFERGTEIQGTVEAIGDNSLTVDGNDYEVNGDTEFEGISGLGDLSVGDEVELEYEDRGNRRVALEIELASNDSDD